MSRFISLAFVVVLCICVVPSFTVSNTSETTESISSHTLIQVTVITSTDSDATPGPADNTHAENGTDSEHSDLTDSSESTTTTGSTSTRSNTTGSNTTGSNTARYNTSGSSTTGSSTISVGLPTDAGKSAGIFFLIIIIVIIGILGIILYILWKKGKRYSFDLTDCEHDTPLRSIEQAGTFEPTKGSIENLDYIPEEIPNKTSPVPNGCSGAPSEKTPCSEQRRVSDSDSSASDFSLTSPVKKVEFNLDLELIGADPEAAKESPNEPADNGNENNNNDLNTGNDSADLFTEINLNDVQ